MIEIVKNVPIGKVHTWLEKYVHNHLTPDLSRYAKGRLRVWLKHEPKLVAPFDIKSGLPIPNGYWEQLAELLGWPFDYCLVTYSGEDAIGIRPHRDAGFADYEAWGLNVSGQCEFKYWMDRQEYGKSPGTGLAPASGLPTHNLIINPGDIVRFNCKNQHAASPSPNRWNLNFWRKKPT